MKAAQRLLKYVKVYTTSDGNSSTTPSAARELDLASMLKDEMNQLGLENVRISSSGYVYGELSAVPGMEQVPAIGFIAHMDTAPDFNGKGVHPQIHKDYDGGEISLGSSGRVLSPKAFPDLANMKGKTVITSDGTTLLGADDKAGIAEIMTACEELLQKKLPHGRICIAFTPDEEIGQGTRSFDIPGFGAKYAYTVDGGEVSEITYENFNAAGAELTFHGFNVHPGDAKDIMKNASLIAMEANAMLPAAETPSHTAGKEGFFHLCSMEGCIEEAKLTYIIRDHSKKHFEIRKDMLRHIVRTLNEKYGEGTVELKMADEYENMLPYIQPYPMLVENARAAIRELGLTPYEEPIRGGTDGAMLSVKGLPCPNLGTGGHAYHGPYEHVAAEDMDLCTAIILEIIHRFTASSK
ncbi:MULTISPECIES: peptidase T [Caproicibacterium]|jgi:tripeptide aminopeptidase|uniref:Peptidase T n=1 Tax=Caproicibacterium lactatifermentans TaxID=2666138 RepID=A0A859DQC5_9FIRM|nr:peptidase T [Caproicibacterium lactatifermentans]ARP50372.1 peptidase T [Ruminococcaceae bacterium CPB6]QKN23906.1 peptidase T [Caproicibacterium lactatifermentans]QKO31024.1 peptidase T [Caproicibacterium lactatifermentans]